MVITAAMARTHWNQPQIPLPCTEVSLSSNSPTPDLIVHRQRAPRDNIAPTWAQGPRVRSSNDTLAVSV